MKNLFQKGNKFGSKNKGRKRTWTSPGMTGKKHSLESRRKTSNALKGSKNHQWKGGLSEANHLARYGVEAIIWRKAVFERDSFTCQKYGTRGGDLVAHHINNFAEYPELRTAIDNGITLSAKAHLEFHTEYGFSNNTREQLIEFLNA